MDKRTSSSATDTTTAKNAPKQKVRAGRTSCTKQAGDSPVAARAVTTLGRTERPPSAAEWAQKRAQGALKCRGRPTGRRSVTLHPHLPELDKTADDIVIGNPSVETALTRSAVRTSHVILIVVPSSPYDLWVSSDVVSLAAEISIRDPALCAAVVVRQAVSPTPLEVDIDDPGAS